MMMIMVMIVKQYLILNNFAGFQHADSFWALFILSCVVYMSFSVSVSLT